MAPGQTKEFRLALGELTLGLIILPYCVQLIGSPVVGGRVYLEIWKGGGSLLLANRIRNKTKWNFST